MALFCKALFRRAELFHPKNTINLVALNPILSSLQIREFALRKGTRERKQAVAKRNKAKKKEEVKTGFVPKIKDRELLAASYIKRKFDDPGLRAPVDNVYTYKYYQWKVYPFADAIQETRETNHPEMYNVPNAPVNVCIHLDFEAEKKTKTLDNFHRMAPMPHGFDHGEVRHIMAFAKDQQVLDEAKTAGAELCGDASLIKSIQNGEVSVQDFQFIIAHPQILAELLTLRGIMKRKFPNSKNGTLDPDVANTVRRFMNGISYSAVREPLETDFGTIETTIGTIDMDVKHLEENFASLVRDVNEARPKRPGNFIIRCFISSSPSKERYKVLHDIYLDKQQEKTEEEEIVNTGIIDEEYKIGEKLWNAMDVAFIENNYSISKKFNGSSSNSNSTFLDVLETPVEHKQDLSFIGDNYSIFKKIENSQGNQLEDCQDDVPQQQVPQEDISFLGNNYSICKKVQKSADEVISDNVVFEQIESKEIDNNIDFDNALSLVPTDNAISSKNTENSSGIAKFNAWFNDASRKEVVETDNSLKNKQISLKNKQIADFNSVMQGDGTSLTAEEMEEENRKFAIFVDKVLPLEQKVDSEKNEANKEDKVDVTKSENLLVDAIENEQNKIVEVCKNNFLNSLINEQLSQKSDDLNLMKETETADLGNISSMPNLSRFGNEKFAKFSPTSNLIKETSIEENEKVGSRNIEEMQQALLSLQLQASRNTAQMEKNILLQKLKIAELELKMKELEWDNMRKK